ncbi:hypothetical protein TNCV_1039151 [Trichonephila clavipes]|uniref:Uncharacterized protein n=1 Tax=Trichonephila clavipes TaxID=2585209 RepID=A0A8X6VWD1_TRICX|nr:hypothetical protein TNCV_1039151 [Trichonephila clavipes]
MHSGVTHTLNSLTPYMEDEDLEMQVLIRRQTYLKERLDAVPRKGSKTTTNNYFTVVDSIIRPNTTYTKATANEITVANKSAQQIVTLKRGNPTTSQQNQTNQIIVPPIIPNFNPEDNSPQAIIDNFINT